MLETLFMKETSVKSSNRGLCIFLPQPNSQATPAQVALPVPSWAFASVFSGLGADTTAQVPDPGLANR